MNDPAATSNGARITGIAARFEDVIAGAALALMAVLPVLEIILRNTLSAGIPGAQGYVQHLTLWVGFMGAVVATRLDRHINISAGLFDFPAPFDRWTKTVASVASITVAAALCWASVVFVQTERESPLEIGGWLPVWIAMVALPLCFALVTARLAAGAPKGARVWAALAGIIIAVILVRVPPEWVDAGLWPILVVLVVLGFVGAPIFVVLGGAALILFLAEDLPVAAIPVETYRLIVSPTIATIPLFALAGYVLADGDSSRRLVRLFRALFASLPGGMAIAAILVCAFFSTFTGASGVTIVALGGLLLPVLLKNGYPERFSVGLLTSTGSIGLLFPPSLAVILYAVIARVPIPDMFIAGIVPGLILIGAICVYAVVRVLRVEGDRPKFDRDEALAAIWDAKWVISIPVVAIFGIFGGLTTLTEAAAVTAVYAVIVEVALHRSMSLTSDVPRAIHNCVTLIGGVFIIIGVAMGLTNYFVDVEIPARAADWVRTHIDSIWVFLLALNVFLLIVGCLMDVFSAIVVVVPLILPIAQVFGIHPLHLGIIFLVNLELGYLTPPVGMNLFLASYRFKRPLLEVGRNALPFLAVLLAVLLLVTYLPGLVLSLPDAGGP